MDVENSMLLRIGESRLMSRLDEIEQNPMKMNESFEGSKKKRFAEADQHAIFVLSVPLVIIFLLLIGLGCLFSSTLSRSSNALPPPQHSWKMSKILRMRGSCINEVTPCAGGLSPSWPAFVDAMLIG